MRCVNFTVRAARRAVDMHRFDSCSLLSCLVHARCLAFVAIVRVGIISVRVSLDSDHRAGTLWLSREQIRSWPRGALLKVSDSVSVSRNK